jgi:hypothetical protein
VKDISATNDDQETMKTLLALAIAIRNLWLLALILLLIVVLDPGLGIYDAVMKNNPEQFLRIALGITLPAIITEHLLGAVNRRRQGALARALLRLQPGLQHVGAIRILIRALETANTATIASVHGELVRLSGKDLGKDPQRWREWLHRLEKISAGQLEDTAEVATDRESPR